MAILSYWVFPVISGIVWLATCLGLLIYWNVNTGREHYADMADNQDIAYISDVAAYKLKPLFIAGCVVTSIFLDLGFTADRWLRHRGRLVPNTTLGEKVLSALTIVCAIIGAAGLILLSIFDTASHKYLHDAFLLVFIAGYVLSAVFICWEYQRLGIRNREHRILRISFWIKLIFVVLVIILAIAFVACTFTERYNAGACLEWTIAFIFSLYVFSFAVDLWPAVRTKHAEAYQTKRARFAASDKMEEGRATRGRNSGRTGGRRGYWR